MFVVRSRTGRSVAAGAAVLVGATFPTIVGAAPVGAAPPGVVPESVSAVLPPGGSTDAEKTIATPERPPSLDVYFLSDTTGSMSSALADVQTNSATILSTVQGGSADVRFGAGNYREVGCDTLFDNQAPIPAADDGGAAASAAIAAWSAVGGCDVPEAALYALQALATGGAGFRSGATPVIVWFGDAPSHDPICASVTGDATDVTEGSATTALTNAGVKVIAVSIDSGAGLDADPTVDAVPYSLACPVGGAAGQAQRITAATGGAELTGVDPDDVADAILSGLAALDVTVSPSVVCDPDVSLSFDAPDQTVTSGTDATFTETVSVAPGATPGSTLHCAVDWLLDGVPAGDAFVQQIDVTVLLVRINRAGGPMCAGKGTAVRADIVVRPRNGTSVVGVVDPVMVLTKVEKAPNAWVVHLKANAASIPAHAAMVTVHTDSGDHTIAVDIPAYTCRRAR